MDATAGRNRKETMSADKAEVSGGQGSAIPNVDLMERLADAAGIEKLKAAQGNYKERYDLLMQVEEAARNNPQIEAAVAKILATNDVKKSLKMSGEALRAKMSFFQKTWVGRRLAWAGRNWKPIAAVGVATALWIFAPRIKVFVDEYIRSFIPKVSGIDIGGAASSVTGAAADVIKEVGPMPRIVPPAPPIIDPGIGGLK